MFKPLETPFYLCSDCSDSIREKGEKVLQSTVIKGECSICGNRMGRKTIYNSKLFKEIDAEQAKLFLEEMEEHAHRLTDDYPEEVVETFLTEIPKNKLKQDVTRIVHLQYGYNSFQCLCFQETVGGRIKRKKFIIGHHGKEFCPHVYVSRLKRQ